MAEVATEETNAKPTVEESNAEPSTGAEEEQRVPSGNSEGQTAPVSSSGNAPPSASTGPDMSQKVYIGNVDKNKDVNELRKVLETFGDVVKFFPKVGFCFVHYATKEAAEACIAKMRGSTEFSYHSSGLKVNFSTQMKANESQASRHVMIRGLPVDVTEDRVRDFFKAYGEVENVKLLAKHHKYNTVACFIDFVAPEGAANAFQKFTSGGMNFEGKHPVEVKQHGNQRRQQFDGDRRGGQNRGGGYNNNRFYRGGYNNDGGYGGGRGPGNRQSYGGYDNNPRREYQDRGRYGDGGGYDRGYNDRRDRGFDDRQQRGGYDDRQHGGYDDRQRGGYDDRRRGGYDDGRRGRYEDRQPLYDDRQQGYDDRQTGYDDRQRGGYDDRQQRGGYEDRGGGYDSYRGGGYGDRREGGYQDDRGYSNAPGPYHDRGAPGGRGGYDRRYEGGAVEGGNYDQGYQGGEAPAPQNAEYHESNGGGYQNQRYAHEGGGSSNYNRGRPDNYDRRYQGGGNEVVYDDVNRGRERSRSPVGRQ